MRAKGELPNFARIERDGCCGPLRTISPTDSPIIWTSIATGRHYRDHGIDGFHRAEAFGRRIGHSTIRKLRKIGLKYPLLWAIRHGWMRRILYDARDVRCRPFWEIASEAGIRSAVVNWWNSWPAAPLNGALVSDRLHFWRAAAKGEVPPDSGVAWPAELVGDLRDLVIPPDAVTADEVRPFVNLPEEELAEFVRAEFSHHDLRGELRFLISADRTYGRVFHRLLDRGPAYGLAAAYFRAPDIAQHCAFDYLPEATHANASPDERRRFGGVVPQAYRFADEIVGGVLDRMRPEDALLVLSDHGYGWQPKRGKYGHARGTPPGVLYALGPEFRGGVSISDACIYDVFPTLARLLGLPFAADLEGRCLDELLTEKFLSANPAPAPVPTYGPRRVAWGATAQSSDVDKDVADHLKALGYMD
jgi:hypothetical protein